MKKALMMSALLIGVIGDLARSEEFEINRTAYADRLHGFWLGQCIANWTGLKTENARTETPFFTDTDWGKVTDYVVDQNPWGADDDTDIEYMYVKIWEESGLKQGPHSLRIVGDGSNAPITIDMLHVMEGEKTQ